MIRRLKKNEYEIKRALSIKRMIQDIEVSLVLFKMSSLRSQILNGFNFIKLIYSILWFIHID